MSGEFFSRNRLFYGDEAIERFRNSSVAVCGVGGLGCVVCEVLARTGVGRLIIVDRGVVDEPDLGRQTLYSFDDLGKPKVEAAKRRLKTISMSHVEAVMLDVTGDRDVALSDADLVVDCLDNFPARFRLEEHLKMGQWLVHGAVENDYGQVTTLRKGSGTTLREFYSGIESTQAHIPVTTSAVFAVATLMAQEALNVILGKPELYGKLLVVELSGFRCSTLPI